MSTRYTTNINLEFFEPSCDLSNPATTEVVRCSESLSYGKLVVNNSNSQTNYSHFPVPLNSDGSPWNHATLYLLSKFESIQEPNSETLNCISTDLVKFKQSIDILGLDYLVFPKRKLRRPTYAYRRELQNQINSGSIAKSTAQRRMSSVIGFYRWLSTRKFTKFEYATWHEQDIQIRFNDERGMEQYTKVKSTDLRVQIPKNRDDYSEFINDGGKLRPLTKDEQVRIVNALVKIGNPEMLFSFLIALTSGARIQTVFTLRLKNINTDLMPEDHGLPVFVGHGTGVDTKNDKRMVLYIPQWLQSRIKKYLESERAVRRRNRAQSFLNNSEDQYVFLTQSGSPYYISKKDPSRSSYRFPPRGNSVRQFINEQLKQELLNSGEPFLFRFHDLRASFGMNMLETKLNTLEDGRDKLFDVLMFIKERMGHNSISTTQKYLDFKRNTEVMAAVQEDFEVYLQTLIDNR